MASAWRSRITAAVGTAGVLVFGIASPRGPTPRPSPSFRQHRGRRRVRGHVKNKSCGPNFGGGPYAGQGRVGLQPAERRPEAEKSTFVSITATFDTGSGTATRSIPPDGQIVFNGTSKGYTTTPAGWKLTGATAVVTKAEPFFVLTHTCPAGVATTAPTTTKPPTTTAVPTTGTVPTSGSTTSAPVTTTGVAQTSAAVTTGVAPATSAPGSDGGLPVTGSAVGGLVAVGVGLVAAGAALLFLRRRRAGGTEA
ncbi:LPXTG cell wall anchor domain-containing protein [Luedemannella flava]